MAPQILVPVDGSPLSKEALALALAQHTESTIHALHVVDPTEPGYSYLSVEAEPYELPQHGSEAWYDRAEKHADEIFTSARQQAAGSGCELTTATRVGRPGREIVRYIETEASTTLFWEATAVTTNPGSWLAASPKQSSSGRPFA